MKNQNLLTLISVNAHLNFFVLDREYRYTNFSTLHKQVIQSIWGVEIDLGISLLDIISEPNDKEKAKTNFDKVIYGGETLILKEEYGDSLLERNYYENKYLPIIENDSIVGVLVIVEEILINTNLAIFEQIVNLSDNGITLTDAKKSGLPVIFANRGFTKNYWL